MFVFDQLVIADFLSQLNSSLGDSLLGMLMITLRSNHNDVITANYIQNCIQLLVNRATFNYVITTLPISKTLVYNFVLNILHYYVQNYGPN